MAGALVSHIAVGFGLNTGTVLLSSIAVMTFVTSVPSNLSLVIQLAEVLHVMQDRSRLASDLYRL